MTCVIALRSNDGRVFLGGDSYCETEDVVYTCRAPKVYSVGPVGVGLAGTVKSEQVLERTLRSEISRKKSKITEDWLVHVLSDKVRQQMEKQQCLKYSKGNVAVLNDAAYIIAFNGRFYFFDEDFSVWDPREPFMAIGAGKYIALGALGYACRNKRNLNNPEKVIRTALEIASQQTSVVRPPYTILSV